MEKGKIPHVLARQAINGKVRNAALHVTPRLQSGGGMREDIARTHPHSSYRLSAPLVDDGGRSCIREFESGSFLELSEALNHGNKGSYSRSCVMQGPHL